MNATTNENSQRVEFLNELLQKALDAEAGYKAAAETVEEPMLRSMFNENSTQRTRFAAELESLIGKIGGDIEESPESTSVVSKLHRVWIGLKGWGSNEDDRGVLEECERGENATLEEYEKVLSNVDESPAIIEVVERQRDRVREELVTIQYLEKHMTRMKESAAKEFNHS